MTLSPAWTRGYFRRVRITALAALLLVVQAAPAAAQAAADSVTPRSVAAGVYNDDQAVRGRAAFEAYCASCHAASDYAGEQFRMNWFGRRVSDLFRILKTTMPEDNVGGLSDDDYTRVIAYILKLNGFPAGKDPLPSDSTQMRQIRIGPPADSVKPTGR